MSGWTDERTDLAKKLWHEGLSASQIAKPLGGVTRNGVIGKLHRLKAQVRAAPAAPKRSPVLAERPANTCAIRRTPALTVVPATELMPPPTAPLTRDVIRGRCSWPLGDVGHPDFGFCGLPTEGRWCAHHRAIGLSTAEPRGSGRGFVEHTGSRIGQRRPARAVMDRRWS